MQHSQSSISAEERATMEDGVLSKRGSRNRNGTLCAKNVLLGRLQIAGEIAANFINGIVSSDQELHDLVASGHSKTLFSRPPTEGRRWVSIIFVSHFGHGGLVKGIVCTRDQA